MQVARLTGVPGSGKTTRALEIIAKCRQQGYHLEQIGFSTFTRAARAEAARRAADAFGSSVTALERQGWFRTLHSTVMRLLGVPPGQLVNNDRAWFRDTLGAEVDAESSQGWADSVAKGGNETSQALQFWDVSRNRLTDLETVYEEVAHFSNMPTRLSLPHVVDIVERYEQAKRADERRDYCDYLLAYAGYRCHPLQGVTTCAPEGEDSRLPIWFQDEAQDSSALLDAVFRRLTQNATYVYLMGDPNQEIYSWAGASGNLFMNWPAQKEDFLFKSWRCSEAILNFATQLIIRNEESYNLENCILQPAKEGGTIDRCGPHDWLSDLDPSLPTLVLARTNQRMSDLGRMLSTAGIPWQNNRNKRQRWPLTAAQAVVEAFAALERGETIDGDAWRRVVLELPATLLERGVKTRYQKDVKYKRAKRPEPSNAEPAWWETLDSEESFAARVSQQEEDDPDAVPDAIHAGSILHAGGTENLVELVCSGRWRQELLDDEARDCERAIEQYGELARDPKIIVSTIHGTKGAEAERVILDTSISYPVQQAIQLPEGAVQERRVWYTGVTRAKDHLTLLHDDRLRQHPDMR